MNRIKTLLMLIALMLPSFLFAAELSASAYLKEASAKLTSAKSLKAEYIVSSPDGGSVSGTFIAKGRKFAVRSSEGSVVFDGKTQWTVSPADREITIYEPTADELMQIDPFAVIRNFSKAKKCQRLNAAKGLTKISLSGFGDGSSVARAVITFVDATRLPESIAMTLTDGSSLQISVSSVKLNSADIKDSLFRVTTSAYPGYEVIDLR